MIWIADTGVRPAIIQDSVRSGRLLKFPRPTGDVHAFLFRDGQSVHARLFLMSLKTSETRPLHAIEGQSETGVEAAVRAWVDQNFPRSN